MMSDLACDLPHLGWMAESHMHPRTGANAEPITDYRRKTMQDELLSRFILPLRCYVINSNLRGFLPRLVLGQVRFFNALNNETRA
jgi:hypothetical protein